jgi:hypothetical protein
MQTAEWMKMPGRFLWHEVEKISLEPEYRVEEVGIDWLDRPLYRVWARAPGKKADSNKEG